MYEFVTLVLFIICEQKYLLGVRYLPYTYETILSFVFEAVVNNIVDNKYKSSVVNFTSLDWLREEIFVKFDLMPTKGIVSIEGSAAMVAIILTFVGMHNHVPFNFIRVAK